MEAKKYSVYKVIGDSLYLEFSTNDVFALIKVGNNSQTWHWKKETSAEKQYSKEKLQKLTGKYYSMMPET